jgi:hypothetical protein
MAWMEVVTTLGGAASGFVMKAAAVRAQREADLMKHMVTAMNASSDSANEAVKRVSVDAGRLTRRVIVFAILFGVILMPFLSPLLGMTVVVEIIEKSEGFLFGLIGGGEKHVFHEVDGVIMIPELRQALLAIIAFYFGQAAAKANG